MFARLDKRQCRGRLTTDEGEHFCTIIVVITASFVIDVVVIAIVVITIVVIAAVVITDVAFLLLRFEQNRKYDRVFLTSGFFERHFFRGKQLREIRSTLTRGGGGGGGGGRRGRRGGGACCSG